MPTIREVIAFEDFSGRTEASSAVEVRARVTGYLDRVYFKDGADVNEGDPLFEIDPRTYKAELDKAVADVGQIKARLRGSMAITSAHEALEAKCDHQRRCRSHRF